MLSIYIVCGFVILTVVSIGTIAYLKALRDQENDNIAKTNEKPVILDSEREKTDHHTAIILTDSTESILYTTNIIKEELGNVNDTTTVNSNDKIQMITILNEEKLANNEVFYKNEDIKDSKIVMLSSEEGIVFEVYFGGKMLKKIKGKKMIATSQSSIYNYKKILMSQANNKKITVLKNNKIYRESTKNLVPIPHKSLYDIADINLKITHNSSNKEVNDKQKGESVC